MTQYVLSLSYGKDSMACLEAIKQLGLPLDRIVTADVWATEDIPADLPPMVEFKEYADRVIKERYGISVEHVCAKPRERERELNACPMNCSSTGQLTEDDTAEKSTDFLSQSAPGATQDLKSTCCNKPPILTYEQIFYRVPKRGGYKKGSDKEQSQDIRHEQCSGATASSNCGQSILGFPMVKGNWCNTYLKANVLRVSNLCRTGQLVYRTQDQCFLLTPLHKAKV